MRTDVFAGIIAKITGFCVKEGGRDGLVVHSRQRGLL